MLAAPIALLALLAQPPSPNELEARLRRKVVEEFERIGRRAPEPDEALSAAARALAARALAVGAAEASDLLPLTEAISATGATDPTPRGLFLVGSPWDGAVRGLEQRRDIAAEVATHAGVGVALEHARGAVVVLLAHRRASLERFPRRFARPPGPTRLCGRLEPELERPEVFVTRPDGTVGRAPVKGGPERFCADLTLDSLGRYALEVIARSAQGPEVVALFFSHAGKVEEPTPGTAPLEPADPERARQMILERVNRLRAGYGLTPLLPDRALDEVAERYSERMAEEGFFAHVSPDGRDLRARLDQHGYRYRTAGENLGQAGGPLAAHFGIELSPGHRQNLLHPELTRLGVGIAQRPGGGGKRVLVTEILARPAQPLGDPVATAYEAIDAKRRELRLPPLARSAALERLARVQAERALASGRPQVQADLHDGVVASLDQVRSAAADFFVIDEGSQVTQSRNLRDAGNDRVGVGLVRGDSTRFGRNKLWVVVIYAATDGAP